MNCANPACGHSLEQHTTNVGCLVGIRGPRVPICPCNVFVLPPRSSLEPLLAQLEAMLRTRQW